MPNNQTSDFHIAQTLQYLYLYQNQIGDEGKIAIGYSLICNKNLKDIRLEFDDKSDIKETIKIAQEWLASKRDNKVKSARSVIEQNNEDDEILLLGDSEG